MRCKNIQNSILYTLLDCKRHTISEIAEKVEISYITAQRHISELAMLYPIETFVGGRGSGGVQMQKTFKLYSKFFSQSELQLIIKGLVLLQKNGFDTIELLSKFTPNTDLYLNPLADTTATTSERRIYERT